MSIVSNKIQVPKLVLRLVFKQLFGVFFGLGVLSFSPVTFANDRVESGSDKTKNLGDHQIHLVCDPNYDENISERCEIIITNPKILDKSKATLDLSPNDISNDFLLDTGQHTLETSSLFSAEALEKKVKAQELERHKYRISRDWLFRLKITEDDKEPDISILSIIVPNDKTTEH